MNIITISNYPDEKKYNDMFKIWISQTLIFANNIKEINNIIILTVGLNNNLLDFISKLNNNKIKIKIAKYNTKHYKNNRQNHNINFKLYNLCLENEPFIYIDLDALIIAPIDKIISASDDKPFIAINHQTIPRHTDKFNYKFLNSGVLIVSKPEFLNFDKIINMPKKYYCPGTDQQLLYNYCRSINYDYTHNLIHHGYNSCAGYKKKEKEHIITNNIIEKNIVHIIHYWDEFKPWKKSCFVYKELESKIL